MGVQGAHSAILEVIEATQRAPKRDWRNAHLLGLGRSKGLAGSERGRSHGSEALIGPVWKENEPWCNESVTCTGNWPCEANDRDVGRRGPQPGGSDHVL